MLSQLQTARFYFPGVLVGPTIEYASYDALISEDLYASGPKGKGGRSVPNGRKRVAYWKMLSGIFFLILFAIYGGKFSYQVVFEEWWPTESIIYRCVLYFGVHSQKTYMLHSGSDMCKFLALSLVPSTTVSGF